jgi:hypothetical protein
MKWINPVIKTIAAALALAIACAPVLAQRAPMATDLSGQSGSLSDNLSSTDGVIRPDDNIDPGISKPAPARGATPIFPPPGSPGGSQNVEPR